MAHDDLNGLSTAVAHRRLSDTIRRFLAEEESLKKSSLHPFLSVRFLRERPLCPLGFAAGMLGVLDATLGTRRDPTAALTHLFGADNEAAFAFTGLRVIITPFDQHMGLHSCNQVRRRFRFEDDDGIHGLQGFKHGFAVSRLVNRAF